ncbi:hypothetical protein F7725_023614 [Dissostichus mawsoni]|uniref:Uncharacterized protein n=1 Tax=Dissostichus mawsoni TaxID=36200 RepID=A0A7J5XXV5_DISMA|nr:hypothetical protein F7725_023614 [Dissostichus mawsoni]
MSRLVLGPLQVCQRSAGGEEDRDAYVISNLQIIKDELYANSIRIAQVRPIEGRYTISAVPTMKPPPTQISSSPVIVKIPTTKLMLRFPSRAISIPVAALLFCSLLDLKEAQMPVPRTSR